LEDSFSLPPPLLTVTRSRPVVSFAISIASLLENIAVLSTACA